jgi:hypothetical protein
MSVATSDMPPTAAGDEALKHTLDEILARRRWEIERILDEYHVPRVSGASHPGAARGPSS